jgi:hypothetical protein
MMTAGSSARAFAINQSKGDEMSKSYEIRESSDPDLGWRWLIVCLRDGWTMPAPSLARAWAWVEILSQHEVRP